MSKTVFINARIVDGTGRTAIEDGVLSFGEGSKILYAGDRAAYNLTDNPADTRIDLAGHTVVPGLFNVHVHLWMEGGKYDFECDPYGIPFRTMLYLRNLSDALLTGVTTIRSVGGSDDIDLAVRKAVNKGMFWGARLVTCGSPIKPHGGHCHLTRGSVFASGPAQFMEAVRTEMSKGVDQVKLMYTGGAGGTTAEGMFDKHITDEEAVAACQVAHMRGKKVAAHLSNDEAIRAAVAAGIDSVEHAYSLSYDTAVEMAQRGCYLVPTLVMTNGEDMFRRKEARGNFPPIIFQRLDAHRLRHMESIRNAVKAGVTLCTGTDTAPGEHVGGTWATTREIELLVEAGLTPLEAIRAGSYNGACLCDLQEVTGSLRAGMEGDFLVVEGVPDRNIADLRNLRLVAKGNRVIHSTLAGLLPNNELVPATKYIDDPNASPPIW